MKKKIIEFIKENKGLLIFYIIMFVVMLLWCEKVENTNEKINEQKNVNYYEKQQEIQQEQQEKQEKQVIYQELKEKQVIYQELNRGVE